MPDDTYFEIDDDFDWKICEALMKKYSGNLDL